MFNGNTPPAGLAAEYYLTMASDKSLYPQAISELRQYVAQHPQENAPRVALGKALTGGKRLAGKGSPCSSRWPAAIKRRTAACAALLWLGPQAGDEQYYDTGCSGIPVTAKFRITFANGAAVRRAAGYANLNSGNTAAAKQQFEEVLQTNPVMPMRWRAWAISPSAAATTVPRRSI